MKIKFHSLGDRDKRISFSPENQAERYQLEYIELASQANKIEGVSWDSGDEAGYTLIFNDETL